MRATARAQHFAQDAVETLPANRGACTLAPRVWEEEAAMRANRPSGSFFSFSRACAPGFRWRAFALTLCMAASATDAFGAVTCGVRRNGSYTCTYFCRDGFICDVPNMRCLPGPEIKRKLSELQEKARKAAYVANKGTDQRQKQSNREAFGYNKGSTYYRWNGDPRIIPTPRNRQGGGFYESSASRMSTPSRPIRQVSVPAPVRRQLLSLIVGVRSLPAGDPKRAAAVQLLRKYVKQNRIPIDADELADCGLDAPAQSGQSRMFRLRWDIPGIEDEIEKRQLCATAASEEEARTCKAYQFGQVVMDVEPELKALCKLQENDFKEEDPAALGECAERKFINALARRDGWVTTATNGLLSEKGRQCPAIQEDKVESLRDMLKRALAEKWAKEDADRNAEPGDPPPGPPSTSPPETPAEQPKSESAASDPDEDPYCAFIARKSVRGELTPGGGTSIPDYCRQSIDKEKSCEQQKCGMADIIAEQERRNERRHPWGVEDYQGIAELQRF